MAASSAVPRVRRPGGAADVVVVGVLIGVAAMGFGPTFGGRSYLVAAGAGAVLGLALGWLGALRRMSTVSLAAVTALTYLLFGGAVVLRQTTIAGVLPTLETVRRLALDAVTSWKGLLTVVPPAGAFPDVAIVPFLSCLVAAVLAGSLALRARRPGWTLLPLAVFTVGVILLGTAQVALPVVQGITFGVVGLGWTAWRRASARAESLHAARAGLPDGEAARASRTMRSRRVRNAAAMLVIAGTLTAAAAPVLQPAGQRHVLRDAIVPPLDLRDYSSPLDGFRRYVKDLDKQVLFTVSGLPAGDRIRLATLDAYTGTVMDVAGGAPDSPAGSGSFSRFAAGTTSKAASVVSGQSADLTVTIAAYQGVWLPDVGQPEGVTFSGPRAASLSAGLYRNTETGTLLSTAGLRGGDAFTVRAVVPPVPTVTDLTNRQLANLLLPAPARVPQSVASVANTFVGNASTGIDRVERLRSALSTGGIFSNGLDGQPTSRAGHGSDRIDTLLSGTQMVGDDEQFAVAMTLMARQLGIPARVVMGFYPKPGAATASGSYSVTGSDVHAWVEVAFAGVGWVPFDPTPSADQPPKAQDPRSNSKPQPQVLQAPPPPQEPAQPPLQPIPNAVDSRKNSLTGAGWTTYVARVVVVGVPLLVLVSPFLLIAVAKSRRRRRRLGAEVPVERLSGAWREAVDAAVDLGTPVLAGATRRETARSLQELYPHAHALPLAERADDVVFGAHEPSDADVDAFWADVEQFVGDMSQSVGRWRRLRGKFSLRSFGAVHLPELVGRVPRAIRRVPTVLGRVRARTFPGGRQ